MKIKNSFWFEIKAQEALYFLFSNIAGKIRAKFLFFFPFSWWEQCKIYGGTTYCRDITLHKKWVNSPTSQYSPTHSNFYFIETQWVNSHHLTMLHLHFLPSLTVRQNLVWMHFHDHSSHHTIQMTNDFTFVSAIHLSSKL